MRPQILGARLALALGLVALGGSVTPLRASESLGAQRVATSMLTFLKIGVGARAVALGEAFTPVADDATTLHWNPAGLAELTGHHVHVTHTSWPADISYETLFYTMPVPRLDGGVGIQISSLRTSIALTTTEDPLGERSGSFDYSDLLVGAGYAHQFTDRFSFGFGVKYLREDLGSQVGGSVLGSWTVDVGTLYRLPYRNFRVTMAWTNFGPDFQPPGGFQSLFPGGPSQHYASFSPASIFAFGVALEPLKRQHYRMLTTLQFDHPADATELVKGGAEFWIDDMVALRAGWNPRADEMQFSSGIGLRGSLGGRSLSVDYAYTDGNALGRIDRFSLELHY